jgi:hypothetical protein
MQQFIEKYAAEILGTLSGFDRLVFRATPRRLQNMYRDENRKILVAKGMENIFGRTKFTARISDGMYRASAGGSRSNF